MTGRFEIKTGMGTLTTFGELMTGIFITAFLTASGTIIWSQFKNNKNLSDLFARIDKKMEVAIALFNEREKNQQALCDIHQQDTCELKKTVSIAVSKLNNKIDKNGMDIEVLKSKVK